MLWNDSKSDIYFIEYDNKINFKNFAHSHLFTPLFYLILLLKKNMYLYNSKKFRAV